MWNFTAVMLVVVWWSSAVAASPVTHDPSDVDTEFPPAAIELTIPSSGSMMAGHMHVANGPGPHPTVILLHGFPGNEKNLDVAQALRRAGFNVLFFNHRGAWGSEGAFSARGNTEDAAAAVVYVRKHADEQRSDPAKISFLGHSLGGFTALYSGAVDASITCTVAVAPANPARSVKSALAAGRDASSESMQRNVPGLKEYSGASLFREVAADYDFFNAVNVMDGFKKRPLMIISGDKDTAVPVEYQTPFVHAAKEKGAAPFKHVVLNADHSFSWNRIEFTEIAVSWMSQNCR